MYYLVLCIIWFVICFFLGIIVCHCLINEQILYVIFAVILAILLVCVTGIYFYEAVAMIPIQSVALRMLLGSGIALGGYSCGAILFIIKLIKYYDI